MGHNCDEVVAQLQSALSSSNDNCHIYESLADAYFGRGSYKSASATYKKALDLNADPVYPKLKIGTIHRCLGQEQEAAKILEELLTEHATYIPALVECANVYYQIAKKNVADKLDKAGVGAIESCLKYCMIALEQDRRQVLPWKIMGDCSILTTNFSHELTVTVASKLIGLNNGELTTNVDIRQFLNIGTHCFFMALRVCEEIEFGKETKAGLHNDIAYSYYIRALRSKDVECLKKAVRQAKKAVSLKNSSHLYWNTLGIVTSHSALDLGYLAQHSFIKSLELEANNAVAWCNLGFLYLKFGQSLLAHACFSKAQSIEPRYAYAWMGQAMVAENIEPTEAMDLFRHACSLENFPSLAALGYTDWVCRHLATQDEHSEDYKYFIEHLAAVQTSHDLMGFYCARHPDDARGFNLHGVISGRLGFLKTARECFENSLSLMTADDSRPVEIVRCNLAAVKLNQGDSQATLDDLQLIENTDFTYYSVAAQAFYNVADYDKSVAAYKQAEAVAPDKDKKSDALLGLGLVLGNVHGLEHAKASLLKSHSLNKNKIGGMLALIALALQKEQINPDDLELAALAYNSLTTIHEDKFLDDVATIKSIYLFVLSGGQEKTARHCLLRYVHMFPTNIALWRTLSHHLFQYCTGESYVTKFIMKYVRKSNDAGSYSADKLLAVKCIREGDVKQASVHAKKACHSWPEDPSHWIILIVALYEGIRSCKTISTLKSTLQTTIRLAQKGIHFCEDPSSEIGEWMTNYINHFTNVCASLN